MTSEEIGAAIDRLKAIPCDTTSVVYSVASAFMDMEINVSYSDIGLRNRLIALLRQADPETHMELPKDANGVPIHVGDEMVSNHSKKKFVVTRLQYSRKHAWMVGGADKDDLSKYGLYAPCETRHYHKLTFEDVVRDMLNDVVCTFESSGGCSAWMSDTKVAEYVDRLREVMADE